MTDGSLKLKETDRTSRSYTEMTSTFPWHQSVIAFCQWTTFRGTYVALSRSVCSMISLSYSARSRASCQDMLAHKGIVYSGLGQISQRRRRAGGASGECRRQCEPSIMGPPMSRTGTAVLLVTAT